MAFLYHFLNDQIEYIKFYGKPTQLYHYGQQVFEDEANFEIWLSTKSKVLGNVTPKSLLVNLEGIEKFKDELGRIEHGILS